MTVEVDEFGAQHIFAPNPKMQGEDWVKEYPPIETTSKWLVNKYTGEIFPNTAEFARRSDILEPYLGELPREQQGEVAESVNKLLNTPHQEETELTAL